ncbi:hypothetical protein ABEF95_009138 [Exophiala dermatitidis]
MDLDETMTTSTTSTPSPSAFQDTNDVDFDDDDDTTNNLFPDNPAGPNNGQHNHPRTPPPANDHLNAAAPGELSPPRSQPNSQSSGTDGGPTTNLNGGRANTSAARTTRQSTTQMAGTRRDDAGPSGNGVHSDQTEQDERPGWGWKNKKAQEDMQRAWDSIVDRDFSLKEYGDVVMQGKAQLGQ